MKDFDVKAQVHKPMNKGYRVKVIVEELGLYINGMVIFPPDDDHENWSVLTPARPAGKGHYVRIVEFNKKLPLWSEIYSACIAAVELYLRSNDSSIPDEDEMTAEEMERRFNEAEKLYKTE